MTLIVVEKYENENGEIETCCLADADTGKIAEVNGDKFNELIKSGVNIQDMWSCMKDIWRYTNAYAHIYEFGPVRLVGFVGDKAVIYNCAEKKIYTIEKDICIELIDEGNVKVPSMNTRHLKEGVSKPDFEITFKRDVEIKSIIDESYIDEIGYMHIKSGDTDVFKIGSNYGRYIGEVNMSNTGKLIVPGSVKSLKVTGSKPYYGEESRIRKSKGAGQLDMNRKLHDVEIAEGVEIISKDCFRCCSYLSNISLPKTIKFIGAGAFEYCTCLSELSIPSGVRYIGPSAFADSNITELEIPDTVEYVNESFINCEWLKKITFKGNLASSIEADTGAYPFEGCKSLRVIEVPANFNREWLDAVLENSGLHPEIRVI